jgi:hypothetical protein
MGADARMRGPPPQQVLPEGMLTPLLLAAAESDDYARSAVRTAVTSEEAARLLLDLIESGQFLTTTYPRCRNRERLSVSTSRRARP